MGALSMAAVTATRRPESANAAAIPPTDLLVLHSAAKLSLYIGARHVTDIRIRVPGLDDSRSPYKSFTRHSQTASAEAASVLAASGQPHVLMTTAPTRHLCKPCMSTQHMFSLAYT